MAFVMHPDSGRITAFSLSDAALVADLVAKMRASADAESHSGGLGSTRNERAYRESASELRHLIWDPLAAEIGSAKLALVVADGVLNLVPFSALPDGSGYLVDHGPVVHMLTTERDLVPAGDQEKRTGLLALGNPSFGELDRPASQHAPAPVAPVDRSNTTIQCDFFSKMDFHPLPGSFKEVNDLSSQWLRWNANEPERLLTGDQASRSQFLDAAPHARILHVATHAFLLNKNCGKGNPLLHSGLVFAGANTDRDDSILTAQQIASLDLSGVDWAVLSACNTGSGVLKDGEGVLGLERSFRVAGARSVIMTLWPVDDEITGQFMHLLYAERFGKRATTADSAWNAARQLLSQRRAAGKSTHPWYWAGFVSAGGWK
jgi:CHAT domain-containing protein